MVLLEFTGMPMIISAEAAAAILPALTTALDEARLVTYDWAAKSYKPQDRDAHNSLFSVRPFSTEQLQKLDAIAAFDSAAK